MKNPMVVLTVALVLSPIGRLLARQLYVSPNGSDLPGCGNTSETPCSTLAHALREISDGDVIAVNASATERDRNFFCHEETLLVAKSVTIRGDGGRAVIGCSLAFVATQKDTTWNLLNLNISGSAGSNHTRVSFLNLTFTSVYFKVFNSHVTFVECKVIDSMWYSPETSPYIGLSMYNTEWQGSVDPNCRRCLPTGELWVDAKTVYINYEDSKFYHIHRQYISGDYCEVYIRGSLFSNLASLHPVHGGIYLQIRDKQTNSVVRVYDSVFEHHIHSNPIDATLNWFKAALRLITEEFYSTEHLPTNVTVVVSNTKFLHNERGLIFKGHFVYINVTSCEFEDNIVTYSGAGIFFKTHFNTPSYVTNCTFLGNAAGSYRPDKLIEIKDILQIKGDKVWLNSTYQKGFVLLRGKGGAIRVERGNVTFTECLFKNNTAIEGGAISINRQSHVSMDNVSFANSPLLHHMVKGHFIHSYGHIIIKSISMSVFRAKNHIAMLYHSGEYRSMDVRHLYMQCPVGYQVRYSSASYHELSVAGISRYFEVHELSYFCESCPQNEYSMDSGYLQYNRNHSANSYFILRLDGSEPDRNFNWNNFSNIQCMPCPYGGKCEERIRALPNFWGYKEQSSRAVKFQHCPKGYCCSGDHCQGFSECAPRRTGRLCGRCKPGYSETHSSPACVRDEKCSSLFLHMVSIGLGIIYMVYLLFQNNIEELLYNLRPTKPPHAQTYVREICSKFKTIPCSKRGTQKRSKDNAVDEEVEFETLNSKDKRDKGIHFEEVTRYSINDPPKDETTIDTTVLFYYLQDASLLQINTIFSSMESNLLPLLKTLIAILFNLDLDLVPGMDKICSVQSVSPSIKLLVKGIIVPYVLLFFVVAWAVHKFVAKSCGISSEKVSSRLATGAMLALLFSYQKLAMTSFTLLNCVPVGEDAVLFLEGQIVCYEGWQYGVMVYAGVCIVPFCLVLLIGPGLLKDGLISLPQFFCACLLPLPFLLYWVTLRLRGQRQANRTEIPSETQSVIKILQGPFKDTHNVLFGSTCGQGVLIGRRLILVLFFTFVNDPLMRMLCMMLVCFIILLHHVYVLPYKDVWGNLAGTASAVSLVIIAAINLVRAGFEAGEYVPEGPTSVLARLMRIFEHLENILLLWFPAGVIVLLFFLLVCKAVIMLVNYLKMLKQKRSRA